MKKKFFLWPIGFLILAVIVIASFPVPTLTQADPTEKSVKLTFDAPFTLHFSQIMNKKSVENAFQLVPKTEGTFKWKDLRTLEFTPAEPLTIGDEYRLLIKGDARSIWMKKMGFDTSISYLVTGPPFVLFTDPKDKSVITNGAITVMFDRPMDFESVNEEDLIRTEPKMDGTLRIMGMSAFQFIPTKFSSKKNYSIIIPAGISAMDGGKTKEAFAWSVVAPSLKVMKSAPSDGVTDVGLNESLTVYFDGAVELDGIKPGANALLYPSNDLDAGTQKKVDGFFNTEVTYSTNEKGEAVKNTLVFSPSFPYQPNEEYLFVLKSDTDLRLEKDFELRFKTIGERNDEQKPAKPAEPTRGEPDSLFEDADSMKFFIRGENPKFKLKKALSTPTELSICQIPSNEFIRVSASNGWNEFRCDTEPVAIEKSDGLNLDLSKYTDLEWVTGVYFFSLKEGPIKSIQLFLIEDSSLLIKRSASDLFVWALDIKSGEPIKEMGLEILSYDGEKIASGTTDDSGVFRVDQAFDEGIYVRGKKETGEDVYRWGLVSDRWTLGSEPPDSAEDTGLVVLLNQNSFFSGDTLNIQGIWRSQTNHLLSLPDANQVTVSIEDSKQNIIGSKRVPLRRNGSFDDSFTLPKDSVPGLYQVTVSDINNQRLTAPVPILITSASSDLFLEWTLKQDHYPAGTAPMTIAKARYGNGIAAGDLEGALELFRRPSLLSHEEGSVRFSFDTPGKKCESDCRKFSLVARKPFVFDVEGEAKLPLTDEKDDFLPSGYDYELRISAALPGEDPVSLSQSFQIHQGTFDLGLGLKHAVVQAGQTIEGAVLCLGYDDQPVADKTVRLSLISKKGEGNTVYDETVSPPLSSAPFSIPVNAEMTDGIYLLRAESQDEKRNKMVAGNYVYVSADKSRTFADDLLVVSDQDKYYVGGRAHLLINEPKASEDTPVSVIVTYERSGLLGYETLKLSAPITEINIPVKEPMFPNFLVTVTRFNRGVPPSFSSVSKEIEVGSDETQILIDLSYDPPLPAPGEKVTVKLSTHDFQNQPLSSVLTLNVLTGEAGETEFSPPLFFPFQALSLDSASNLNAGLKSNGFSPSAVQSSDGIFFKPSTKSVYFNPLVATDSGGKAEITFTLPDKKHDLLIETFATKNSYLFGHFSAPLRMNHRLLLQPILPSFALAGDQTIFGASVKNISDQPVHSSVNLVASDFVIKGDPSRNISLEPGQQTEIAFNVLVDSLLDKDAITVKFQSVSDMAEKMIPVYHLKSSTSVMAGGLSGDFWSGRIFPPADAHSGPGVLQLTMSGSPLSSAKVQAEALKNYEPENTYVLAAQLLSELNFLPTYSDPNDLAPLQPLLLGLLGTADENGGYHLWNDSAASPTLSALILFAYSEAASKGLSVDPTAVSQTISYLWKALDENEMSADDRFFILWALGKNEQYDTQRTLTYYRENTDLSPRGKAFLLLTLDQLVRAGQGSLTSLIDSIKTELFDTAIQEEDLVYFDDSQKTTALLLFALGELDSANPLLPPMAHYLVSERSDLIRELDPEKALWKILSLSRYAKNSSPAPTNLIAQAKLNGVTILDQSITNQTDIFQASVDAKTLNANKINDIFIKKEGSGTLYMDANLTSYLDPLMTPRAEENLLILRQLLEITDEERKVPATSIQKGKRYVSELEIIVPKDLRYVTLSDEIPAGLKANSGAAGLSEPFVQSEFSPNRVTYFAPFLPAGVYKVSTELRAILPGTYMSFPAVIQPLFEPSVIGRTEGGKVQVID